MISITRIFEAFGLKRSYIPSMPTEFVKIKNRIKRKNSKLNNLNKGVKNVQNIGTDVSNN